MIKNLIIIYIWVYFIGFLPRMVNAQVFFVKISTRPANNTIAEKEIYFDSTLFSINKTLPLYEYGETKYNKDKGMFIDYLIKHRIEKINPVQLDSEKKQDEIYRHYTFNSNVETHPVDSICYKISDKEAYKLRDNSQLTVQFANKAKDIVKLKGIEYSYILTDTLSINFRERIVRIKNKKHVLLEYLLLKIIYEDNTSEVYGTVSYEISEECSKVINFIAQNRKIVHAYKIYE